MYLFYSLKNNKYIDITPFNSFIYYQHKLAEKKTYLNLAINKPIMVSDGVLKNFDEDTYRLNCKTFFDVEDANLSLEELGYKCFATPLAPQVERIYYKVRDNKIYFSTVNGKDKEFAGFIFMDSDYHFDYKRAEYLCDKVKDFQHFVNYTKAARIRIFNNDGTLYKKFNFVTRVVDRKNVNVKRYVSRMLTKVGLQRDTDGIYFLDTPNEDYTSDFVLYYENKNPNFDVEEHRAMGTDIYLMQEPQRLAYEVKNVIN